MAFWIRSCDSETGLCPGAGSMIQSEQIICQNAGEPHGNES